MTDTIELLETIGKNASLRHAATDELAYALERADASEALMAAALAGDSALLAVELGQKPMKVNHDVHAPGHEEEPEQAPGEADPLLPAHPDQGGSVRDQ